MALIQTGQSDYSTLQSELSRRKDNIEKIEKQQA